MKAKRKTTLSRLNEKKNKMRLSQIALTVERAEKQVALIAVLINPPFNPLPLEKM